MNPIKTLAVWLLLLGAVSLFGELEGPPSSILDEPSNKEEDKKKSKTPVLHYKNLIEVVEKIRQNPNQITSEYDLDLLQKEMEGKPFLIRDTVRVKTDPYISHEKGFWFSPSAMVESFLIMPINLRREYGAIKVHDYVTIRAKLVEVGRICRFEAIQVEVVEPFNPRATFEDFSGVIKKINELKEGMPYFEFKALMKRETEELKGVLGHVTGHMLSLKRNKKNAYIMKMDVEGIKVQVECHPAYLNSLLDLEPKSKVSMAVIMDRSDIRDGYFMTRGCLVRL